LELKKTDKAEAEEYRLTGWRDIRFRPHDLRHTFVTNCRDKGIDIHLCMKWCGHTSERMILEIYDHVSDEREKNAILLMDA
jgi:integrase